LKNGGRENDRENERGIEIERHNFRECTLEPCGLAVCNVFGYGPDARVVGRRDAAGTGVQILHDGWGVVVERQAMLNLCGLDNRTSQVKCEITANRKRWKPLQRRHE
jgi:hypothetical protein